MIVNADDLGYSAQTNAAIAWAFERGLVTRTSIMANMPGFEEACALMRERRLQDRVGLHLVLTEGEPLSSELRGEPRLCGPDGRLRARSDGWGALMMTRSERNAIAEELSAQLARCRENGLPVTHLDSHHHVHVEPVVGMVIARRARSLGIRTVRIARNCGEGIGPARSLYKRLYNLHLQARGLRGSRYFGGFDDLRSLRASRATPLDLSDFELMTHPIAGANGVVVDAEAPDMPLEQNLLLAAGFAGVETTTVTG